MNNSANKSIQSLSPVSLPISLLAGTHVDQTYVPFIRL